MAIILTKTLQTIEYDLYILTTILNPFYTIGLTLDQYTYASEGHFNDGFLPIIRRNVQITDGGTVTTITALFYSDPNGAVEAAETYLVANDAYYAGGSVV
jgi:hypothetical protein